MATALNLPTDPNHVIVVDDVQMRIDHISNDNVFFSHLDNPLRTAAFPKGVINRKRALGQIQVLPFGLLPPEQRPFHFEEPKHLFAGLLQKTRDRAEARYAMVCSYLAMKEAGLVTSKDHSIAANMGLIREGAEDYLARELPCPVFAQKLQQWREGTGPKPKTRSRVALPDAVGPRTLRGWVADYRIGGKRGLIDNSYKQGNRTRCFTYDEVELMMAIIKKEYLTRQRKTIRAVVTDVAIAFDDANKSRRKEKKHPMRTPGRDAVRRAIRSLSRFRVLVARFGESHALARMRLSKVTLPDLRPLQEVEMDEWEIDLLTLLAASGLLQLFDEDALKQLRLNEKYYRWWLVVAICRRTRVILGMTLTPNPRTSSAIKCLEMVTVDKADLAGSSSALTHWSVFGVPETLFVDNGPAFKSGAFTTACADLGIMKVQTIAGKSSMRPYIESFFAHIAVAVMQRMLGRTFGSPEERGDYPSEKLAVHSLDDLAFALVRWVVDAYHNEPHEGLNGRTPLQQWEADLTDDNYPIHGAPTERTRFLAFGIPMRRTVQKDGITVMNIQYAVKELGEWLHHNGNKAVEVRWHPSDIGKIYALLDGEWYEIPATVEAFHGVDATTWLNTRKSLRAKDPKRKEWEEETVRQAIRAIENLRKNRALAYKLVDHGWDEHRLRSQEQQALGTFAVVPTRARLGGSPDGFGEKILPVAPTRATAATVAMDRAPGAASTAIGTPTKRAIIITKRAD